MSVDPILQRIAMVVSENDDIENLVRPLLSLLETITGLESTYVTTIDIANNVQKILFAHNAKDLVIPEGLSVPWGDTLCKRALDEKRGFTNDVATCWGDSDAARLLGITTYMSEPINIGNGELYGTLCGASAAKIDVNPEARQLLSMFAKLIARQLERDRLLEKLQSENRTYSLYALSDPLTGIANRRALLIELSRALANADRTGAAVLVAFIDLDGFKIINDQYGHDAGDRFLIQLAYALTAGLRDGDFVARYGGDEFIVFGLTHSEDHEASRLAIRRRLEHITTAQFDIGGRLLDYGGASVGVTTSIPGERDCEAILARADAAMYEIKKNRRPRNLSKSRR